LAATSFAQTDHSQSLTTSSFDGYTLTTDKVILRNEPVDQPLTFANIADRLACWYWLELRTQTATQARHRQYGDDQTSDPDQTDGRLGTELVVDGVAEVRRVQCGQDAQKTGLEASSVATVKRRQRWSASGHVISDETFPAIIVIIVVIFVVLRVVVVVVVWLCGLFRLHQMYKLEQKDGLMLAHYAAVR